MARPKGEPREQICLMLKPQTLEWMRDTAHEQHTTQSAIVEEALRLLRERTPKMKTLNEILPNGDLLQLIWEESGRSPSWETLQQQTAVVAALDLYNAVMAYAERTLMEEETDSAEIANRAASACMAAADLLTTVLPDYLGLSAALDADAIHKLNGWMERIAKLNEWKGVGLMLADTLHK